MGTYDAIVEALTPEAAADEQWGKIMQFCDEIKGKASEASGAAVAIRKRVSNSNANVALHALTLLDACVQNCGDAFVREVATQEFSDQVHHLLSLRTSTPAPVCSRLKDLLVGWSKEYGWKRAEFKGLTLLVESLHRDGHELKNYSPPKQASDTVFAERSGDADLDYAIHLSLKEENNKQQVLKGQHRKEQKRQQKRQDDLRRQEQERQSQERQSQQPRQPVQKETVVESNAFVARALYKFDAKGDDELAFVTGQEIVVVDSSDDNWWMGTCNGKRGLFPTNFVERIAKAVPTKSTLKKAAVEEPKVDTELIDKVLEMITNFNAANEKAESKQELESLIEKCAGMQEPVNAQLQQAAKRKKALIDISRTFNEAMDLYELVSKEQEEQAKLMAQQATYNQQHHPQQYQNPTGVYQPQPQLPAQGFNAYQTYGQQAPPQQQYGQY